MPFPTSILKAAPRGSRAFTLLELCIVLLLLALLAGVCMPAMNSALTEQALRSDAGRLSLLVKEAMTRCQEENEGSVLRLDGHTLTLAPAPAAPTDEKSSAREDSHEITIDNAVCLLDFQAGEWKSVPSASWTFEPGDLCPMPRVRVQRGDSSIEMSFDALTGDVEDETVNIP